MSRMYRPKYTEMNNPDDLVQFIRQHSFGLLCSNVDGRPFATHLPLLYDPEAYAIVGHMAKANPQWQQLDGQAALVVFSGPHAYISPSWYGEAASVPTWNYVAVHVSGTCRILQTPDELEALLTDAVRFYEPSSDLLTQTREPFYQQMMKAIVGFRIDISSIEGKAKLSQNKSAEVQRRVIGALSETGDPGAREVARRMQDKLSGLVSPSGSFVE